MTDPAPSVSGPRAHAAQHVLVVLTEAVSGREEEFNYWYDNTHLADVTSLPGFVSAKRYELSSLQLEGFEDATANKYLAIYQIEGDSARALDALAAGLSDGSVGLSTALDPSKTKCWSYTARA